MTTSPLWVALAAPFFLGERVASGQIGIGLALVGSVINQSGQLRRRVGTCLGQPVGLAGCDYGGGLSAYRRKLRVKLSLLTYVTLVYHRRPDLDRTRPCRRQ